MSPALNLAGLKNTRNPVMRDQAFSHVVHRYVIHPSSQAIPASVNPYSFNLLERALSALSPVLPHAAARPIAALSSHGGRVPGTPGCLNRHRPSRCAAAGRI